MVWSEVFVNSCISIEKSCNEQFVNVFSSILIVCLQRCALRSQDFTILHREYIEFESPDQIRTLSSGFYIRIGLDSIRTQTSVRNLIVTKTKNVRAKINCTSTIEFLRKSACGCTLCRPDFIMRTAIKALINLCPDSCAYGNSPDSTKYTIIGALLYDL